MTTGEVRYARPVPLVGDRSSARERADDPAGWAMGADVVAALHAVVDARRDVRRFRPDPVPADVLERVLTAAHHAPSVGHSQPWRFLVVTAPATRERAALLADRERLRQAAQLEPDAARRLLDLQLEGLREAPLGVVVACDRRTPAAGVLGRATYADADLWSCACAVQNLWLAARAEGLGVGWVTLFAPADLAALLGLPDGVETLGWLCLGWPDERPPEPGLERAGWSRRVPLADVVLRERWPDEGPAAPPSRLRAPGPAAVVAARDDADELLTPPGSLGVLDRAVDRLSALGHAAADRATLLLVGADHPVVAHGVSAYPASTTREVLRAAVAGTALGPALATACGMRVEVVDSGVDGGPVEGALDARPAGARGDLVGAPALEPGDAELLLRRGRELGARLGGGAGVVALGEVGIGNTTVAAALVAGLLRLPVDDVVGLGAGSDSATLDRKRAVVVAALARHQGDDLLEVLAGLGGPEVAVLTGALLGAAAAGALVVLDGMLVGAAALLAVRLEPGAQAHLVAGQRSRERAHAAVLADLGLEPLLDLRLRAGEGAGAVLATDLLLRARAARGLAARTA